MACSGCARRRAKIKAALFAAKRGLKATAQIYRYERETIEHEHPFKFRKPRERKRDEETPKGAVSIHDLTP